MDATISEFRMLEIMELLENDGLQAMEKMSYQHNGNGSIKKISDKDVLNTALHIKFYQCGSRRDDEFNFHKIKSDD